MKYRPLLLLILLSLSANCFGDIVFFDVNHNPKEIEAARRAADHRGEKLHVFPTLSRAERARMDQYTARIATLTNQYRRAPSEAARIRLEQEYNQITVQMSEGPGSRAVNPASVKEFVDQLAKDKVKVSSLVVSGHDGNGEFTGLNGSLMSSELMEAFGQHPELKDGVKSLFLAGCYTTKPGTLDFQWKPGFPNLEIVNGYVDSAPLGDKPAGHEFIYNALSREKEILAAKGEARMPAYV